MLGISYTRRVIGKTKIMIEFEAMKKAPYSKE